MYHVYNEYSVLPKLNKISPSRIFENTEYQLNRYIIQKSCLKAKEYVCLPEIKQYVLNYLVKNHPFKPLATTLERVILQIPEDIVIHRTFHETDWLAYTNVACPSGWNPQESVGKSFNELHNHVPDINLTHSRHMLKMCIHKGPFERFVWSVVYENKLDYNSRIRHLSFEETGEFFVKVERQVIVGIPEYKAFMFILKPYIIEKPDVQKLYDSLSNMSDDHKSYKGITVNFLEHLKEKI